MSHRWLFLLLLPALAFGQAPPSSAPSKKPAPAPAAQKAPAPEPKAAVVPLNAAVITVNGLCDVKPAQPKPADCKTVITRAAFERMLDALNPRKMEVPPQARQQVASTLANLMVAAHRAEELGLQNKPETQELLRLQRMRVLTEQLTITLQQQYAHSSPEEIQKYYAEHKAQFEEAALRRVFIPKPRPEEGKAVDEAAVQAMAEKIRQQALAGEDFDKLEKEAFDAAGLKQPPPPTTLGAVKLASMPQVSALKPGEVSPLIPDAAGFYLYKMESRQPIPLEQAQPEIENALGAEKFQKAVQEITNSAQTELNPAYFGAPPQAAPGIPGQAPAPKPPAPTKPPAPPPRQ